MDSPKPATRLGRTRRALRGIARVRMKLRSIARSRSSPQAIAGGVAVGVFVAFTPTLGFQMILAVFLATLLKVSRPATILPVWITNPATVAPIYAVTYAAGRLIWRAPDAPASFQRVTDLTTVPDAHPITGWFCKLLDLGVDMFVPLLIGGVIVGTMAAVPSYFLVVRLIQDYRKRREHRMRRRHGRPSPGETNEQP